jgi:hypothetical protein
VTEHTTKNALGLFLIASHLLIVALLLGTFIAGGLSFRDMTTAVALVTPMFTAYTVVVIKYFVDNRTTARDRSAQLSGAFVAISFGVPAIFVTLVAASILLFAANVGFSSFEQLKSVLAILEGAYGLYLGKLVDALFPHSPAAAAQGSTPHAAAVRQHGR